jgi:hypothetical protein
VRVAEFNPLPILILLKIVKIMETFAFGFCTLWVPSPLEGQSRLIGSRSRKKEDWMKRAIFLVTIALVLMLMLAPVALAQTPTPAATPAATPQPGLAPSGGPAIILPAAALLLGAGILTYAILRRR